MDNFNKSIKERELRNKHSKKHSHGQEQSNPQEQMPKKHNLPPNILKEDIPFREGELDELLSDNLNTDFSISDSLKKINMQTHMQTNNIQANKFMLKNDDDDNDNNDQDLLMQSAFWDKIA